MGQGGEICFTAMSYYGLDWTGTVLGLISIYYLGRQRRIGFVFRIAASLFWIAFGVVAGTAAGVIANFVIILLSLHGFRRWGSSQNAKDFSTTLGHPRA